MIKQFYCQINVKMITDVDFFSNARVLSILKMQTNNLIVKKLFSNPCSIPAIDRRRNNICFTKFITTSAMDKLNVELNTKCFENV